MIGELSHGFENRNDLHLPKGLKFEPRFDGNKIISFDIILDNNYAV